MAGQKLLACSDFPYPLRGDPEVLGNINCSFAAVDNSINLGGCEFGKALSLFPNGVSHVIGIRPKKQMGWLDTRPIVASMTNVHPRWNGAKGKFPSDSVRSAALTVKPKETVSGRKSMSRPLSATRFGYLSLGPKSFGGGHASP